MFSWDSFTIMHKEQEVASITKGGQCSIFSEQFLPYNLYLNDEDDIDSRINNLENFYYWCSSRMLTLDRKYAKEILNTLEKKQAVTDRDRAEISISYHCLSLTDVYWVKKQNEKLTFQDISLYRNSLAGAFVDVSLRGKEMTLQNLELLTQADVAGDVATVGVAPKAWIRKNGTFYLLKGGDERDVDAELLASRIIDCFAIEHVRYSQDEYDGHKVSVSEIISSEEKSLVPSEYVEIYALNHGTSLMDIIREKSWYEFNMMNIIDYLIGNNDRHWANWGFFADNENNELTGLHPLMDYNKAFTAYSDMSGGLCQTLGHSISQQEAAVQAVRSIGLNQISEVHRDWFSDKTQWNMFSQRLTFLKNELPD